MAIFSLVMSANAMPENSNTDVSANTQFDIREKAMSSALFYAFV